MIGRRAMLTLGFGAAMGATVSGCALHPVYGTSGHGFGIGHVEIGQIEGRLGYLLRQELLAYSARENSAAPARALTITLNQDFIDVARRQDSYADRVIMVVGAHWALPATESGTGLSGDVQSRAGFDGRDRAFGAIGLQADAEESLAKDLAEAIWLDMAKALRP